MNRIYFLVTFLVLLVLTIGTEISANAQNNQPVIVISPGHGWWNQTTQQIDPGAIHGDLIEKDINLDVAQYTRDYLSRCPANIYLTRNGDDPDHTINDVTGIVNGYNPTVAISIHTNSAGGTPSGTEGWYTVNGFNDEVSQQLAASMSQHISTRLGIPNRGAKPETDNRHGGLYIHWWSAPSALIEIAFLQGDAELLRNQKDDFGRSIAQALLEHLDIDHRCADQALTQDLLVSTYLSGETKINEIKLLNDGLAEWGPQDYLLASQGNKYGADESYPLLTEIPVKETATWEIPATAPPRPGIYRQEWQLFRGNNQVSKKITVYMIVVPEEARQLKDNIDQRIEELRQRGEEELEKFIKELEQEAVNWVTRELPRLICGQPLLFTGLITCMLIQLRGRRRLG
jgi:N-acetylmuramoyl-L-alanine amidase